MTYDRVWQTSFQKPFLKLWDVGIYNLTYLYVGESGKDSGTEVSNVRSNDALREFKPVQDSLSIYTPHFLNTLYQNNFVMS